jgi:hypothetical protein
MSSLLIKMTSFFKVVCYLLVRVGALQEKYSFPKELPLLAWAWSDELALF